MFVTRVGSFAFGFALASGAGLYVLRQDIEKHHAFVRKECASIEGRVRALEESRKK
jgi:hypothetical protein